MAPLDARRPTKRTRKAALPGVTREDSDDELGVDDLPWEWIYQDQAEEPKGNEDGTSARKRKRVAEDEPQIVGARMGSFTCNLGDIVFLKAEGSGEAWVAIICDFLENEDGDKVASFMWFSSQNEIRNKQKKRTDHVWVSHPRYLVVFQRRLGDGLTELTFDYRMSCI